MTEDKEKILQFIEDYKSHQVLWDSKHRYYTNKIKRNSALITIGKKHNLDIRMVKNKIKSLRSYFAKEHRKIITKDNYQTTWFAYGALAFILDSITSKETKEYAEDILEDMSYFECTKLQDESTDSQATYVSEVEQFPHPTNAKRRFVKCEDNDEERYTITKMADTIDNKNECDILGQLIACKLKNLNPRNRLLAERRINNILYDLELKEIDSAQSKPSSSSVYSVASAKKSTNSILYSGYISNDE